MAVKAQKANPGEYTISPASPLFPGEYAVVLRPVSKSKKFSGGDVARAQGDGFLFDAVWSLWPPMRSEGEAKAKEKILAQDILARL